MQWIHDPSKKNVDNLHNVRRDAKQTFQEQKEDMPES